MKLPDKMREVARANDAREAGRVADFCRFRLGWNYSKLSAEWCRVTGQSPADFENLMYEADAIASVEDA